MNNNVFAVILAAYLWGKITTAQFWWMLLAQCAGTVVLAVYTGIKQGMTKLREAQKANQSSFNKP